MEKSFSPFIEGKQVLEMLQNQESLTILDCRFDLQSPTNGRHQFMESHIPTAQYVDLDAELSAPEQEHGGRHPLPSIPFLEKMFQSKGVFKEAPVIIYDQGAAPFAARCYWVLRFLGHQDVYILQGGFSAWTERNYPLEKGEAMVSSGDFVAAPNEEMAATVKDVQNRIKSGQGVLVDSREYQRYLGNEEPIDQKAGRIPTARHYFWKDVFQGDQYKTSEQLKQHFQALSKEDPIIVYCGSGVTAAPNAVAMYHAGFKHVKLYIGSFSDWISYDDSPISFGE